MRADKTELRPRIRIESGDQTEITVRNAQKLSLFEVPLSLQPRPEQFHGKTRTSAHLFQIIGPAALRFAIKAHGVP